MFFMLEHVRNDEDNPGKKLHAQLGIVVAGSIEQAAAKLNLEVLEVVRPPESCCQYANLEHGYSLEEFQEIKNSEEIPFHQM